MNIKQTENLVTTAIARHKTRSRVIEHPDGEPLPENSIQTDEPVRDWKEDEPEEAK